MNNQIQANLPVFGAISWTPSEAQGTTPPAQSVAEQVEFVFTVSGSDADLPANALIYQMISGPPGAIFDQVKREFRWTPTEVQGLGNYTATFRVTDNNPDAVNSRELSATGSVSIAAQTGSNTVHSTGLTP